MPLNGSVLLQCMSPLLAQSRQTETSASLSASGSKADINRSEASTASVVNDPKRTLAGPKSRSAAVSCRQIARRNRVSVWISPLRPAGAQ